MSSTLKFIITLICILLVIGVITYYFNKDLSTDIPPEEPAPNTDQDLDNTVTVKIAKLTAKDSNEDFSDGCYKVSFQNVQIPKTESILNDTLKYLFEKTAKEQFDPNLKQFKYGQVTIKDGVARIFLTGEYSGPDTCPGRESQQIAETALQFESVKDVEIYLNGNPEIFWYTGDMRGDVLPTLTTLAQHDEVPDLHGSDNYDNAELTFHRYYKKGLVAQITYTGLKDDSTEAVKFEAILTNTFSEENQEFPWELSEWQIVSQRCVEGRGHEDFSREECI